MNTRAKRLEWMGALALIAVTGFAIYVAWPPLYRAGLPGNSHFIAGLQAIGIIMMPIAAALVMLDCIERRVPVPMVAWICFVGSVALILLIDNYPAKTAVGVALVAAPTLGSAAGFLWLLAPPKAPPDDERWAPLADATVLYRFYRTDGQLLYVGITRGFEQRRKAHALAKSWWPEVARTECAVYANREAAARAEHAAIMGENPVHNAARYSLEGHLRAAVGQ